MPRIPNASVPRRVPLLALTLLAGALAVFGCEGPRGPAGEPGPEGSPGPTAPPASDETFAIGIADAVVGSAGTVYVTFSLTDDEGVPRGRDGLQMSWTLASLVDGAGGATSWNAYFTRPATGDLGSTNQPTADGAGAYEYLGGGEWRYAFSSEVEVSPDATHRVAVYARRTIPGGGAEIENAWLDFVPSGGAPDGRAIASTASCNGCHDPLEAHGGQRRAVELCVTCHTPQLFDPDSEDTANPGAMNPLDMATMTHRIHQGAHLPSLEAAQAAGIVGAKYHVFGYQGREHVYGRTLPDNTDAGTLPQLAGVLFPQDTRNCTTCHADGAESDRWTSTVTRAACSGCHDATWFGDPGSTPAGMTNHTPGPYADDSLCASCHVAQASSEFDLSVPGAHVIPTKSTQLRGLEVSIVDAALAGTAVTVVFTVKNADDGSDVTPLSTLGSLAMVVNGPTTDYRFENFYRFDVRSTAIYDAGTGHYTALLPNRGANDPYWPNGTVIPPGATGTFAVGIDARRSVTLAPNNLPVTEPPASNPVFYFAVDGSASQPRRSIVAIGNCTSCHADGLMLHGGQRVSTDHCVLCHNPGQTDWGRRPKSGGVVNLAATEDGIEERSVDFRTMIHKIHTGEELDESRPYAIYGFGSSLHVFDEVLYPGNRARCSTCHVDDSYLVESVPANALPVTANETDTLLHGSSAVHPLADPWVPPIQAACLACHDSSGARVHAELNTNAAGEEACSVCHGEGREFSVREVHAQHVED